MAIKWDDGRYNCYRAHLSYGIDLQVNWEKGAYQVYAFDIKLKEPSTTLEDGKERAVKLAKKIIKDLSKELEEQS